MIIDTDLLLRLEQRITNLESYICDTINKVDEENLIRVGRFGDSCYETTTKENPDCPEDCPETGMHEIRCKKEITDTERLNFIEKIHIDISCWKFENTYEYTVHYKTYAYDEGGFKSIREAIDAAMISKDGD